MLGAAGGVGLAAVQLAKCMGARVIAVARGHSKMQALREVRGGLAGGEWLGVPGWMAGYLGGWVGAWGGCLGWVAG